MLKLQKIILEKRYISVAMSEYDDFEALFGKREDQPKVKVKGR